MSGNRKGPRPSYSDPRKLKLKMQEYFESRNGGFPSYTGMLLYLQLTEKEVDELRSEGNKNHEKNCELFEWTRKVRETWLVDRMTSSPDAKTVTACMNLLKQEINGGYVDKAGADKGKVDLNIKIDGVGGWGAFE